MSHHTAFGGWPVELADTAGLRGTDDAVENLGIERSRREQQEADLVVLVLDRSQPLVEIDRELIAKTEDALLVANKSDLPPAWTAAMAKLDEPAIATVSAERGDGIEGLIAAAISRIVPVPPGPGDAVPFRSAHRDEIGRARSLLQAGDPAAALLVLESLLSG